MRLASFVKKIDHEWTGETSHVWRGLLLNHYTVVLGNRREQVAYSEQEVKKILSIRCEEEDVEMDDEALILLTKYVPFRWPLPERQHSCDVQHRKNTDVFVVLHLCFFVCIARSFSSDQRCTIEVAVQRTSSFSVRAFTITSSIKHVYRARASPYFCFSLVATLPSLVHQHFLYEKSYGSLSPFLHWLVIPLLRAPQNCM